MTISEASEEGTIAQMLANSATVTQLAEPVIEAILREDGGKHFRRDINAHDLTEYVIATALSLLLGIIPGTNNTDVARRYIEDFILPAIVTDPSIHYAAVVGADRRATPHSMASSGFRAELAWESMADLVSARTRTRFRDLATSSTLGQISSAFQDEGRG
jgi:hypothetical protein